MCAVRVCVCVSVCVCCPHAACSRRSRRRHCSSASCHYDGVEQAGAAFDELADVTWRLASHLPHLSSNWPPPGHLLSYQQQLHSHVYLFIARCDKLSPKVVANCRDLFAASASRRSSLFFFFFYCLSATFSCCHLAAAAATAADVASVAAAAAVVYLPSSTLRPHHASNSQILLACPPADCFYYKPTHTQAHTHTHR